MPFQVRGLQKKNEALLEEGRAALEEYDSSIKELNHNDATQSPKVSETSGRRVFGSLKKDSIQKVHTVGQDSDSEAEKTDLSVKPSEEKGKVMHKGGSFKVNTQLVEHLMREYLFYSIHQIKSQLNDNITEEAGSGLKYDVSVFDIDFFGKVIWRKYCSFHYAFSFS